MHRRINKKISIWLQTAQRCFSVAAVCSVFKFQFGARRLLVWQSKFYFFLFFIHSDDLAKWPKCLTFCVVCVRSNVWCRAQWSSPPKDCSTIYRKRFTNAFNWRYAMDGGSTHSSAFYTNLQPNCLPFSDIRRWQIPENHMPRLFVQIGSVVWIQGKEFSIATLLERFEHFFDRSAHEPHISYHHISLISFQKYLDTMCWATISLTKMRCKIRNSSASEWMTIWPISRPFKNLNIWSMESICMPTAVISQK